MGPDTRAGRHPGPHLVSARPYPVRTAGLWWGASLFFAGVAGTWLTWRFFVATAAGQRLDEVAFAGSGIGRRTLWRAAEPVLDIVSIPFLVVVLGAAAVIALARHRGVLLLQVALLLGGTNLTTQVLKHSAFDRPDLVEALGVRANSLPSGHTTVAASVAVALLLVVPRRARPAVAVLGAGYTASTGVSTMIGGWHRPSDVIAACTVVLAWAGLTTLVAAVATPEHEARGGAVSRPARVVSALLGLGALAGGAVGVVTLLRIYERLAGVQELTARADLATAYVGSALGVVAAVAALFAAALVAHELASGAIPQPYRDAA